MPWWERRTWALSHDMRSQMVVCRKTLLLEAGGGIGEGVSILEAGGVAADALSIAGASASLGISHNATLLL